MFSVSFFFGGGGQGGRQPWLIVISPLSSPSIKAKLQYIIDHMRLIISEKLYTVYLLRNHAIFEHYD